MPNTALAIPDTALITEPIGSSKKLAKNSAKPDKVLYIKATISIIKFPVAINKFPMKEAATDIAPATTPIADTLVPAK
ncbi:Uncharacterised protein [Clostridioides difficile]|nr:Uncharacterised protein [Clostridioides difficile]